MNQLSEKDQQIVQALRGDRSLYREALKRLMKSSQGKVMAHILKRGGTKDEAKDLFQEGAIILMHNVRSGKFEGGSTIETYFIGICKQLFIHYISRKKKTASDDEIPELPDKAQENHFLKKDIKKERKIFFRKLINNLGEICKKFFEDKALGFSLEVYADRENIEYQSAKNRSAKCQKKLRDLMLEPHIQSRLKEL